MENRFKEFQVTDDVFDEVMNEKVVIVGNELIDEHNTHIASTALHMSTEENSKLAGIETGAEVNNISDANAADLTDGTDTTLHTHPTSGITGFATAVRGMVLTGLSTATNAVITATDTILSALGKLQKQITDHKTDYTLQVPYAGTTTGTANTYVLATPTISALSTGMAVSVKFNFDSTAASTLNWCGLGAKAIKKANGTSVTNLKATGIYTLRYDGTNFILQGEGASGDATASDLISGKTATVDAGEITGTMPNNGAVAITPSTVQQAIAAGYHNGSGYVVGDADLVAGNILSGKNIFGVDGSAKRAASGTLSDFSTGGNTVNLPFTPSKVIINDRYYNTSTVNGGGVTVISKNKDIKYYTYSNAELQTAYGIKTRFESNSRSAITDNTSADRIITNGFVFYPDGSQFTGITKAVEWFAYE